MSVVEEGVDLNRVVRQLNKKIDDLEREIEELKGGSVVTALVDALQHLGVPHSDIDILIREGNFLPAYIGK